ncbi:SIP domain-containing protein [Streptomyces sp. SM12]|uniref:SIP domain-containing protein n=1 Tax=Streptomyces sp. SM12 TaxID=1071602 RepID=UPI0027E5091A|nr:SIP domain-containing protein [Streptomyces sp. SM12]
MRQGSGRQARTDHRSRGTRAHPAARRIPALGRRDPQAVALRRHRVPCQRQGVPALHARDDRPGHRRGDGPRPPPLPGAPPTWCGIGSARGFRWTEPAAALAVGDASTLGLMVALTDRAREDGARLLAVVEVDGPARDAARDILPDAVVLTARAEPGEAVAQWLMTDGPERITRLAPEVAYLAGHSGSVQRQRTLLREHHGIDRSVIRTQPYWATGRTGL